MAQSIAIVAPSSVPFQIGGAEKFWWGLHRGLSNWSDHFVELIKIPAPEENFADIVQSYKNFSRLDLAHFDMVITTKYPAWMLHHPNHVLYLQHTLRGLYDTYKFTELPEHVTRWPSALNDLMNLLRMANPGRNDLENAFELIEKAMQSKTVPSDFFAFPGPLIREIVHFFDRIALSPSEIKNYIAISKNVCNRKDYLPDGVKPLILPHPSDIKKFSCETGEYIFTASRLNGTKRLDLIIKAMNYVKTDVPLKIAGTGPDYEKLMTLAEADRRIEFLGHVPDSELPHYYSKAIFVPFVPYDEDYGLITIEAMMSGKPVVTTSDSGGVCEYVKDGITGFCVPPDPVHIGFAMERLASDPEVARKMGIQARESVEGITWRNTAFRLLYQNFRTRNGCIEKNGQSCIVCSIFPPSRTGSGGQRRLYHLCRALAKKYVIIVICPGLIDQTEMKMLHKDGYLEISLPWVPEIIAESNAIENKTGISAGDIGLMRNKDKLGKLEDILREFGKNAEFVFLEHPYLYYSVIRSLPDLPIIYDAANVESDLKAQLYAGIDSEIPVQVFKLEEECCNKAAAVICCSQEDVNKFKQIYNLEQHKLALVPNGCDTEQLQVMHPKDRKAQRKRLAYPDSRLALFLGSCHLPNQEACEHIFKIAENLPDVEFLIGGPISLHSGITKKIRPKNVHLLGILSEPVKNMLLESVDLGLNPITSGSGTNLKIVEYAAAGLPTISTPFGMRGLDGDFTDLVYICDLDKFPEEISAVLKRPRDAKKLLNSCENLLSRYEWNNATSSLLDIIEAALDS